MEEKELLKRYKGIELLKRIEELLDEDFILSRAIVGMYNYLNIDLDTIDYDIEIVYTELEEIETDEDIIDEEIDIEEELVHTINIVDENNKIGIDIWEEEEYLVEEECYNEKDEVTEEDIEFCELFYEDKGRMFILKFMK